ncbi:protein draper-like [Chironomus tepperi]|uniref:protein draper-like n=1 Tax=Chironomus tepperi TaxID=113505 RepID=UPI00391FA3A8
MKFLYILSMIFCVAHGFRFRDLLAHHKDISPHNECSDQPNGTRLPHASCNHFILCDGGSGLVLSCRASEPNFNRCEQRCVNDRDVCDITDCNGDGGQPQPTSPTPPASTTTRFDPPTVQVRCPTPCELVPMPDSCGCAERWTCISGTCQCNTNIPCPMTLEECMEEPGCGGTGGCAARCLCEPEDTCFCDAEVECGFPQDQCAVRCGCAGNCNCGDDPENCVCNEVCSCIQPPLVCPFEPTLCDERCGCEERCLCNGNVCVCDLENRCPARDVFWKRY